MTRWEALRTVDALIGASDAAMRVGIFRLTARWRSWLD